MSNGQGTAIFRIRPLRYTFIIYYFSASDFITSEPTQRQFEVPQEIHFTSTSHMALKRGTDKTHSYLYLKTPKNKCKI